MKPTTNSTHTLPGAPSAGALRAQIYKIETMNRPVPYRIANALVNSLIEEHFRPCTLGRNLVVYCGCGTADLIIPVLESQPNLSFLGIDVSSDILVEADRELSKITNAYSLIELDVLREPGKLMRLPHDFCGDADKNLCVLIRLMAHHFETSDVARLYAVAREMLSNGGLLVVQEVFGGSTYVSDKVCSRIEFEQIAKIEDAIRESLGEKSDLSNAGTFSIAHYEGHKNLRSVFEECDALTAAGFERVDVVFKHGQIAVICAEVER